MGAASFEGPAVVPGGAVGILSYLHQTAGEVHALALTTRVPE
jgi:hypothetical protein